MEIFNISQYYRKAVAKGSPTLSYTMVKNVLSGVSVQMSDKDKKAMLKVLDEAYEEAKKNITKQS